MVSQVIRTIQPKISYLILPTVDSLSPAAFSRVVQQIILPSSVASLQAQAFPMVIKALLTLARLLLPDKQLEEGGLHDLVLVR